MRINFTKLIERFLNRRRYWLIPLVMWIGLTLISLYQSVSGIQEHSRELATESARHLFEMITLTRRWNALHGGVYVPITEQTQPNPYLQIPNRDIETLDHMKLTMVNPAYMTRQLSELASQNGATFHITSLRPIRPLNAPDPWERTALESFEEGGKQQTLLTDTLFRYMAPLEVKGSCLKCHAQQGYKLGDVRGGISVTIPSKPIFGENKKRIVLSAAQHTGLFLIISLMALLLLKQLRLSWQNLVSVRHAQEQVIAERTASLSQINDRLREEIAERSKAENLYRLLTQSAPEAIITANTDGKVVSWNQGAERIFGYMEGEMLGEPLEKIIPIRYQAPHQAAMERAEQRTELGQLIQRVELTGLIKGGEESPIEISLNDWEHEGERFFTAVILDISERKQAEENLRLAAKVFESTVEGVMITDHNRHIIATNQAFTRITGYEQEELLGKTPIKLKSGRHNKKFYKKMWRELNETGTWSGEIWNKRKNGEIYPEWLSINVVLNEANEATHFVGVFTDISEIKQTQKQLDYLAHHDPLTDLPNRRLFNDRLEHAIIRSTRYKEQLAVMFIDLDNFKDINDSLGHATGDQLLCMVSDRIIGTLRISDTVARQGGDEFIVLLENVGRAANLKPLVEKLLGTLQHGYEFNDQTFYITASIGLSCFPGDGQTADSLIQHADAAMYEAKARGRNGYVFYSGELTSMAYRRMQVKGNLRHALERDEFRLCYQPQINTDNGEIEGLEALLRWHHPDLGEFPPNSFIPHAENNGLIVPIGEWVMRHACHQFVEWRKAGLPIKRIAINVAGQQIQDSEFVQIVTNIIKKTGIAPEMLELEVTENFIMRRAENAIGVLDKIKALGVQIAIDDFGTGYSSLSYLKRLPIHKLKIDQSFIRDLTVDPNDVAITRAIIALGQSMNLGIIAEGVETTKQEQILRENGCTHMQGFLYSRPLPESKVPGLFDK